MMDELKASARRRGLRFIVTYGDNTALDFFEKEKVGFKKLTCAQEKSIWKNAKVASYKRATAMAYGLKEGWVADEEPLM